MTPDELREALTQLYGDERAALKFVAFELDISTNSIKSWLQGRASIPGPAAAAVRLLCETPTPSKSPLTLEELDRAIDALYDDRLVSQRRYRLAMDLGVSLTTVISWRKGRRPLRGPANAAIQLMLKKKYREADRQIHPA
jgi:DNA-binding transcriptional regulator YiaG